MSLFKTTDDLIRFYEEGHVAARVDMEDSLAYADGLLHRNYGEVCGTIQADVDEIAEQERVRYGANERGLFLPFLANVQAEAQRLGITGTLAELSAKIHAYPESQDTGDCVSHAVRHLSDTTRNNEIYVDGELEEYRVRTATEPIYGHRNYQYWIGGQGMVTSHAVKYIHDFGGMLLRQRYETSDGVVDLTKYDASKGISWSRRKGRTTPESLREIGLEHPVDDITPIRDVDQGLDCFRHMRSQAIGASFGVRNSRDKHGVASRGKPWAHAMEYGGLDERPSTLQYFGDRLVLVNNSWGLKWISGTRKIRGTDILIPAGSFWIIFKDYRHVINNGDAWTCAGARGWEPLSMPDMGATGNV